MMKLRGRYACIQRPRYLFMHWLCAVVLLLGLSSLPAWGEGRARVTFAGVCQPLIKDQPDLLALLSAYDLAEEGTCLASGGSRPSALYCFPFVFPARLKGDKGAYKFLVVIDDVSSLSSFTNRIIAGTKLQEDALGIAIWPLPKPVSAP